MNMYTQNLNRIEFMVTLACTGHCKHCSEGEHTANGAHIDGDIAAKAVHDVCSQFNITSLMTFGGEPLLYLDTVCKIHRAAKAANIRERHVITNGFFSKDAQKIEDAAFLLAESGVNAVLLSVDAFHQETISLKYVKAFASAVQAAGIPLRTHPAWLVDPKADNAYNRQTGKILQEFEQMGIGASDGNVIFPHGNALKYLSEYFDSSQNYINPYTGNPKDIHAVCVSPNGDVLGGNLYQTDILPVIENYRP